MMMAQTSNIYTEQHFEVIQGQKSSKDVHDNNSTDTYDTHVDVNYDTTHQDINYDNTHNALSDDTALACPCVKEQKMAPSLNLLLKPPVPQQFSQKVGV